MENGIIEQSDQLKQLTAKLRFLEKRINDRKKEEENTSHTSFNEESIKKV